MHWFLKFLFGMKLYVFRTVPPSIIRSFPLYTQQWYMWYRLADICSCSQAVSKPVWRIPLLCVQWKTPDDGQRNCPKYIVSFQKEIWEISASSWFCYKKSCMHFLDMRGCKITEWLLCQYIMLCFVFLQAQMPDPKTYKQHFENKHPKSELPDDLKEIALWYHYVWYIRRRLFAFFMGNVTLLGTLDKYNNTHLSW